LKDPLLKGMSPEDLGTQVKLGGPGGESPWPPHTNMAKTTECPQENVGVFRIRARQGQGDTGNGPRLCAGAQTRKRGGRHIRTFPRNSGRRGKYTLKEESNRAYSPKRELKSFGRLSTTEWKTSQISPFT
jgi:hypothetical protein